MASGPPQDPSRQGDWLRSLNARGQHEAVVRSYESGEVANTEGNLGEYMKALVRLDRLDSGGLLR